MSVTLGFWTGEFGKVTRCWDRFLHRRDSEGREWPLAVTHRQSKYTRPNRMDLCLGSSVESQRPVHKTPTPATDVGYFLERGLVHPRVVRRVSSGRLPFVQRASSSLRRSIFRTDSEVGGRTEYLKPKRSSVLAHSLPEVCLGRHSWLTGMGINVAIGVAVDTNGRRPA